METLGIPMACAQPAMRMSHATQSSRRWTPRFSNGRQTKPQRLCCSVRALQRERSASFPVVPPCSPTNEQNCFLGSSSSLIERLPAERSSLSRLDVELMLRRMVRADAEPSEKDTDDEADKTNDSGRLELWKNRARNMQTTAQIFYSMMFWTVLFFISTIMDGKNGGGWNRRSNGRRRK